MRFDVVKILATFFGIGYLPYCRGTWASLVGLGIYFLLRSNSVVYISFTLMTLITGFLVSSKAENKFGKKDAPAIVIDEVAAILVLLYFVPRDLFLLIMAFIVFRIVDILKPYPIKKIEKISGSWGIMLDDLIACFYTISIIWVCRIFIRG